MAPKNELDAVKEEQLSRISDKAAKLEAFLAEAGIPLQDSAGVEDKQASLEASLDIALRIAEAGDLEAIFNPGDTIDGRDLVGKRFTVTSTPVARRSTFKEGTGWYLQWQAEVVDADTGEMSTQTVSCGALNVMTQMAALNKRGRLIGEPLRIEQSEKTASGYSALWLKPAGQSGSVAQRAREADALAGEGAPF